MESVVDWLATTARRPCRCSVWRRPTRPSARRSTLSPARRSRAGTSFPRVRAMMARGDAIAAHPVGVLGRAGAGVAPADRAEPGRLAGRRSVPVGRQGAAPGSAATICCSRCGARQTRTRRPSQLRCPSFVQHIGGSRTSRTSSSSSRFPGDAGSTSGGRSMRKLLWIGDAACDSGFARARTRLSRLCGDVGRRRPRYQLPRRPARLPVQDLSGLRARRPDHHGRTPRLEIVAKEQPDVVVFQNDPWNVPRYVEEFNRLQEAAGGRGDRGRRQELPRQGPERPRPRALLDRVRRDEAAKGGCFKPTGVVPLGVDLEIYKPRDRVEARKPDPASRGSREGFIVLNANRNQPRKRIDLTIRYFAEFFHKNGQGRVPLPPRLPDRRRGRGRDQLAGVLRPQGSRAAGAARRVRGPLRRTWL
jgi:hypothetical protein